MNHSSFHICKTEVLLLYTHSQQIGIISKKKHTLKKNIVQFDLNYAQIFYKYMMQKEPKWLILALPVKKVQPFRAREPFFDKQIRYSHAFLAHLVKGHVSFCHQVSYVVHPSSVVCR